MKCKACDDLGILPVDYVGESRHYALCLCPIGERWRNATNNGKPTNPAWHVFCSQNGIPFEHIVKLEDYATPDELAAFGFRELTPADSVGAIAAAARGRKGR